jgi:hypothetical protein
MSAPSRDGLQLLDVTAHHHHGECILLSAVTRVRRRAHHPHPGQLVELLPRLPLELGLDAWALDGGLILHRTELHEQSRLPGAASFAASSVASVARTCFPHEVRAVEPVLHQRRDGVGVTELLERGGGAVRTEAFGSSRPATRGSSASGSALFPSSSAACTRTRKSSPCFKRSARSATLGGAGRGITGREHHAEEERTESGSHIFIVKYGTPLLQGCAGALPLFR